LGLDRPGPSPPGPFDRAEAWLRDAGFLPPAAPAGPHLFDSSLAHARLTNLRRLQQARSAIGLRAAADSIVDGGHAVWFDKPSALGVERVQLRLTGTRDAARATTHRTTLPHLLLSNSTQLTAPGTEQHSSTLGVTYGVGGSGSGRVDGGEGLLAGGADIAFEQQWTDATLAGHGLVHDQATRNQGQSSEVFDVPLLLTLDAYASDPRTPAARFGATPPPPTPPQPDPAARPGPAAQPDPDIQSDPATRPVPTADPPAPPAALAGTGTLRIAVPHARTLAEAPAPADTTAVRRVLTPADRVKLRGMSGGRPVPGVFRLPGDAVVDVFAASAELIGAVESVADDTYPGHVDGPSAVPAPPGSLPGISPASFVRSTAPVMTGDPSTTPPGDTAAPPSPDTDGPDPSALAAEALRAALSPAQLVVRAQQIFGGGYVVEGLTLPGHVADRETSVEIRAYAGTPTLVGTSDQYQETGTASAESGGTQRKYASGWRGNATFGGRPLRPDHPLTKLVAPMTTPTGSYTGQTRHETSTTLGSATQTARVATEENRQHRLRSDVTVVVTVRRGDRNLFTNLLGAGSEDDVTFAVDLPGALEVLVTDDQVRRNAMWFADVPALADVRDSPPPGDPSERPALPPRYAGTGVLGLAAVLDVVPLAPAPTSPAPPASTPAAPGAPAPVPGTPVPAPGNPVHDALLRQVEHEAPGSTTPGNSSYVPGLRSRVADHTSVGALRALPGRGPREAQRFHFVYAAAGGARLVEVELHARPALDAEALRALRGRATTGGTGLENVPTHAPATLSRAVTRTHRHQAVVGLVTRHPRFGEPTVADRTGPTLGTGRQRATTTTETTAWDDRFWLRTDNAADFDVPYTYTTSVRSAPLTEWPPNLVGAYLESGLSALAAHLFHRAPVPATVETPARVTVRFTGGETAPDRPEPEAAAPFGRSHSDPATTGDPRFGDGSFGGPVLKPTGPVVVYAFDGHRHLTEALAEADPGVGGQGLMPAGTSQEDAAARLGELIRSGTATLVRPDPHLVPGAWPDTVADDLVTTVTTRLHNPRPVSDSGDVTLDRVRHNTTTATTGTVASKLPVLAWSTSMSKGHDEKHQFALAGNVINAKPVRSAPATATAHSRREWSKTGDTTVPKDGRGTRTHEALVDVVVHVRGPESDGYVSGTTTVRLAEHDLLGHGVTAPRTDPQVYDLRSLLRDQPDAASRDWRRHPLDQLPYVLAGGLDPADAAAQLWLAADLDDTAPGPDGLTARTRALHAASRTARVAGRPVELALRTEQGVQYWLFDSTGTLNSTDDATNRAWSRLATEGEAYAEAFERAVTAKADEDRLRARHRRARAELAAIGERLRDAADAVTEAEGLERSAREQAPSDRPDRPEASAAGDLATARRADGVGEALAAARARHAELTRAAAEAADTAHRLAAEQADAVERQRGAAAEQLRARTAMGVAGHAVVAARSRTGERIGEVPLASLTARTPRRDAPRPLGREDETRTPPAPAGSVPAPGGAVPASVPAGAGPVPASVPAPAGPVPTPDSPAASRTAPAPVPTTAVPAAPAPVPPRPFSPLSRAQSTALAARNLTAVDVPGDGDCLFHALLHTAPQRFVRPDGTLPSPAELRAHLSRALLDDLALPPDRRTHWEALRVQAEAAVAEDRARRRLHDELGEEAARLSPAERAALLETHLGDQLLHLSLDDADLRELALQLAVPRVYDNAANDLALPLAARLYGFPVTLLLGTGVQPMNVGDEDGDPVVLVRMDDADHWMATEPLDREATATEPLGQAAPAPAPVGDPVPADDPVSADSTSPAPLTPPADPEPTGGATPAPVLRRPAGRVACPV
ncbi:hypothetical protein ABTY23_31330, partial [Streptomyces sp. NPDC096068]